MFSMPATVREALMRRVHRDRRRQDTDVLIIDYWSHVRRMQLATITCYDSDCCGHRVQRPRLREVIDVARSPLRILNRRSDRSTGIWDGCPRGRWELWLPLGRELSVEKGKRTWR